MNRVHVLGSINNDIVVFSDRHPSVGETVHGNDLRTFPGGKGANQAVASARAGASTSMLGLVGDDGPGQELRSFLETAGVDVSGVRITQAAPTGTALITVAGGDNTIVVVAGANGVVADDVIGDVSLQVGDVVLAQFETPASVATTLFRAARLAGALTILNPAPATDIPSDLLGLVDYLIVNETEFALTFGFDPDDSASASSDEFESYDGVVIATLGAAGLICWDRGDRTSPLRIQGVQVDAVDSTGAGDCFCGYVAAGLARGEALAEALHIANRAAALSVTRAGAATSIPTLEEVSAR